MPSELPYWVARYVGLPYLSGGRTTAGVDCWGLFNLVWQNEMGGALPSYDGPSWRSDASIRAVAAAAAAYAAQFARVEPGQERLGDGIFLRNCGLPLHIGLVISGGTMLHILEGGCSAVTRYNAMQWRNRIVSFHRYCNG